MENIPGTLALAAGLGLLGFIEPCSIGSSLIFLKSVEGGDGRSAVFQTLIFAATRACTIGLLGAGAALAGSAIFGFQKAGWVVLGVLYLGIGIAYLGGQAGKLMVRTGPSITSLDRRRSAALFGVLFGLNIPACAAPLLALLLTYVAVGSSARAVEGFAIMMVFGLALSLPLVLIIIWPNARQMLDRMSGLASRAPAIIGAVFLLLGAWSVYTALSINQ